MTLINIGSDSAGLRWDLTVFMSKQLLGDGDAVNSWATP